MNLCIKYQTNKIDNIQQKHTDALKRIRTSINPNSNLTNHDIAEIFKIIDDTFFNNQITELIKKKKIELTFEVSSKLTCCAGICRKYNEKQYKLIISVPIMEKIFSNDEKRYNIGGLTCYSKIECIYHVICHELIHFINFVECSHLVESKRGHNGIFKQMIKNIFGHTNSYHSLHEDLDTKETKKNTFFGKIKIGDIITVKNKSKIFQGHILAIGAKRVKIQTADNKQFYIPYHLIESCEDCIKFVSKKTNIAAASNEQPCPSHQTKDECAKYDCIWGKTGRCSKKRKPQAAATSSLQSKVSKKLTCPSYKTKEECATYECIWGKTGKCSKKRIIKKSQTAGSLVSNQSSIFF